MDEYGPAPALEIQDPVIRYLVERALAGERKVSGLPAYPPAGVQEYPAQLLPVDRLMQETERLRGEQIHEIFLMAGDIDDQDGEVHVPESLRSPDAIHTVHFDVQQGQFITGRPVSDGFHQGSAVKEYIAADSKAIQGRIFPQHTFQGTGQRPVIITNGDTDHPHSSVPSILTSPAYCSSAYWQHRSTISLKEIPSPLAMMESCLSRGSVKRIVFGTLARANDFSILNITGHLWHTFITLI